MPVSRITVVMPCRDAAPWIEEALDSLAAQSLRPTQVVVVDDGSTDGSADVVEQWKDRHPDLQVGLLRRPPSGVHGALAAAVAAAHGELLCRLDADDRLAPDYLERLAGALEINPDLAYAYPVMRMFGDVEGLYYTRDFSAPSLVYEGNFVCAGALVRRAAYDEVGGVADLPAWEDWDLWLRLLGHGHHGVLVPEAEYGWRRHGSTRNQLRWTQRRALRLKIWWRHRGLCRRYARYAVPMLLHRIRHPITQQ